MQDRLAWIDEALLDLDDRGLRRRLRSHEGPQGATLSVAGRELVNFGSNDYLSLAGDARLCQAAAAAAREAGWGAGASPLVTGRTAWHDRLEAALAEFEGAEASLVFSSGYAANAGAVTALAGRGDAIFADELNHASLIDGCRLSRADVFIYPHGDWRAAERLLQRHATHRRRLIVTDGLFSMEGDLAPLVELADLAAGHECMLLVDEAHATGVFGRSGRGVAEHLGVADRIDVRVGTLSKSLGGVGGFVVGRRSLVEWLVNVARPYIFSTALPPPCCAAALAALEIVRAEPKRGASLLTKSVKLRQSLQANGWDAGTSRSQIVPIVIGDAARAVALAERLHASGYLAPAIRPPSVPDGRSLLRISLCHGHSEEAIDAFVAALGRCPD